VRGPGVKRSLSVGGVMRLGQNRTSITDGAAAGRKCILSPASTELPSDAARVPFG
jgi:hypothetical protein